MKRVLTLFMMVALSLTFIGCMDDAYVASQNLSKEADMFRIYRRVVFYNGITDEYILQIEGYCSIDIQSDGTLKVTVKNDDGSFMKHYLGLSDNVTYFVEQLDSERVSDDHYKVIFKPKSIIPNIEIAN